jgi:hypothetical protein
MTPSDISVHEAGHSVIAARLSLKVDKVVIGSHLEGGGHAVIRRSRDGRQAALALATVAGPVAHARYTGRALTACGEHDLVGARLLVGDANFDRVVILAHALVQQHWTAIVTIARALDEHRTLTGERLSRLLADVDRRALVPDDHTSPVTPIRVPETQTGRKDDMATASVTRPPAPRRTGRVDPERLADSVVGAIEMVCDPLMRGLKHSNSRPPSRPARSPHCDNGSTMPEPRRGRLSLEDVLSMADAKIRDHAEHQARLFATALCCAVNVDPDDVEESRRGVP